MQPSNPMRACSSRAAPTLVYSLWHCMHALQRRGLVVRWWREGRAGRPVGKAKALELSQSHVTCTALAHALASKHAVHGWMARKMLEFLHAGGADE